MKKVAVVGCRGNNYEVTWEGAYGGVEKRCGGNMEATAGDGGKVW